MDPLHTISVRETATEDLHASGARLTVRIAGHSFFTGTEAFKKAAEVAACVNAVKECGLSEDDIRLLGVSMEVESGILMKSSAAVYHLNLICRSIDLLGPVLAAVSSQKNSKLVAIAWDYPDLARAKRNLLQTAVQAAKDAAQAIAQSLAVTLVGVHKLSYEVTGLDNEVRFRGEWAHRKRAMDAMVDEEALPNLNLGHTTRLAVTVNAEFLVGAMANGS